MRFTLLVKLKLKNRKENQFTMVSFDKSLLSLNIVLTAAPIQGFLSGFLLVVLVLPICIPINFLVYCCRTQLFYLCFSVY